MVCGLALSLFMFIDYPITKKKFHKIEFPSTNNIMFLSKIKNIMKLYISIVKDIRK